MTADFQPSMLWIGKESHPIQIDFESLFANSPNAYVLLDPSLTMVWMNDAYLRATMRERTELVGRKLFDEFPSDPKSDSHQLLVRSLDRVLATGEVDEIALIRYDIRNPDGSMDAHFWSATHTPLKNDDGNVAYVLQHTVDVTELEGLRRLHDEMGILRRANVVQARNRDLKEEADQFKSLFEQAPGFVAVLSGTDHRFLTANGAYRRMVGDRDIVGKPLAQALPEVIGQGFLELLDHVRQTGEPYVGRRAPVRLENTPEEEAEVYLDFIYQPLFDRNGEVEGVFVQGHDVTDEVAAEERQKLLINELNHRVKNTLAVVQGLAMQSFRSIVGSEKARSTFEARLNALAAAHNLLTERNWEAARLLETLTSSISATTGSDSARVSLDGPDISLTPQAAVGLAMITHELCTNAIKYGALSKAGGRICVNWSIENVDGADNLVLDWRETGGPPVSNPARQGFGTRLIRSGMTSEMASSVEMNFNVDGLHCQIRSQIPDQKP